MGVSTTIQKTTVDQVGSVTVSDIAQDPISGNYLRTITVNTLPDGNGGSSPQFILVLSSPNLAAIELTAPSNVF